MISSVIGIERKTTIDFAKSLVDGRLFDQAKRMSETFEKPVIIIEGKFEDAQKFVKVHRSSILGAYITLGIEMNITLIQSRNEEETAEIIKRIALYQQRIYRSSIIPKPTLKDDKGSIAEWQLSILQCFPYIGPKIAKRIIERFQTLRNFCNASITELSRIEGLSERKATEIYQIINSPSAETYKISKNKHIIDYIKRKEDSDNNDKQ